MEQSNSITCCYFRLCRFGFELLEWQFLQNNTKLVVLENTRTRIFLQFCRFLRFSLDSVKDFRNLWTSTEGFVISNSPNVSFPNRPSLAVTNFSKPNANAFALSSSILLLSKDSSLVFTNLSSVEIVSSRALTVSEIRQKKSHYQQ